jgi:hypothetical protein
MGDLFLLLGFVVVTQFSNKAGRFYLLDTSMLISG